MIINKECHLIDGAKNSAIYDLKNNKVYSINHDARIIIEKAIKKQKLEQNESEFIDKLKEQNLFNINEIKAEDNLNFKEEPKLKFAWLELTENCNLNCVHCYGKFGKPTNMENNLKIDEWKKVVDYLVSIDCNSIQLIGGEPLIFKDFNEILNHIHNKGIKHITVFTNATLLTDEQIRLFKEYNVKVRISLYSSREDIHDKIVQVKGSFSKTFKNIIKLKENGVNVSIAIIAMKENESTINEIKDFLEKNNLTYTKYDVIRPGDISDVQEHGISDVNILKNVYQTKPEFFINKMQFYRNSIWNPCWYGKIAVTANGDIIPCVFCRNESVGNIKEATIEELKNNTLKKWIITKDFIKECKDCEYRYCCHDCRPLALGVNNSLFAKNPRCCYDPYEGKWQDIKKVTKELCLK